MQNNNLALRDVHVYNIGCGILVTYNSFFGQPSQELKRVADCCASHFSSAASTNGLNTSHFPSVLGPCSVEPQMLTAYCTLCWCERRWQSRRDDSMQQR